MAEAFKGTLVPLEEKGAPAPMTSRAFAGTLEPLEKPESDFMKEAKIQLGGVGAAAAASVDVVSNFVLPPVAQAIDWLAVNADIAVKGPAKAYGLQEDLTNKARADFALAHSERFGGQFSNPVQNLFNLSPAETPGTKAVAKVGTWLGEHIQKTADLLQWELAPIVDVEASDIVSLVNVVMAKAGVDGAHSSPALARKVASDVKADMAWVKASVQRAKAKGDATPVATALKDMQWSNVEPEHQAAVTEKVAETLSPKAAQSAGVPVAGGLPQVEKLSIQEVKDLQERPGFLRTAEDKAKLKEWDQKQESDPGYGRAMEAAGKPGFLRTAEDKAFLRKYGQMALAAGLGLAAWEGLTEEQRDDGLKLAGLGLGMAALPHVVSDSAPLASVLEKMDTTLLTLERLPQNRFELTRQMVEEQLKRPDVSAAEKAVFQVVLEKPWDKITAKELVGAVADATRDLQLSKRTTDDFADYGLDAIGRKTATHYDEAGTEFPGSPEAPPATTHIWQLPSHMEVSDANHFRDPRYFGHTRAFEEDGVRHVVEIQSDLAQGKGEPVSEALRADIEQRLARAEALLEEQKAKNLTAIPGQRNVLQPLILRIAEIKNELRQAVIGPQVAPLVKHWFKRLVREELNDVAKRRASLEEDLRQWRKQESEMPEGTPGRRAATTEVKRLEEAVAKPRVVRFADADTVAKVEGWPTEMRGVPSTDGQLAMAERLRPQHQGIYDRYKKEGDKFFSQLGGSRVTDPQGHTWWEVPIDNPKMNLGKRVQQFGGVDSELLYTLAAAGLGAAIGYEAYQDSSPKSGAALGMVLGLAAKRTIPSVYQAMKDSPLAREAVKELSNKLYTLQQGAAAHGLDTLNFLKKELPKDYGKFSKEIAEHLDDPKKPISARGQELIDTVIKPIQEANRGMVEALRRLGYNPAELQEDYGFHRIPKASSRKSLFDEITKGNYPFSRSFSTSAPAAFDRTVWNYVTDSGEKIVGVTGKDGKVNLFQDKRVVAKGSWSAKSETLKAQGKEWRRERATIEDIEKSTKLEYHKEALLAELDSNIRLQQAVANAYVLRDLEHLPGFENIGMRPGKGQSVPPGWQQVQGSFQLQGMFFEPRIAETLQDFLGERGKSAEYYLSKANRVLVGSMFWNPLPHIANVAVHALQEKGVVSLMRNLPTNLRTSLEAYREVSGNGPKFRAYLREGGAFMYPDRLLGDFHNQVIKAIGEGKEGEAMAKAFGYSNPMEMTRRLYKASADSLWKWNDIFMMQGYLEKEARGMTREKAMVETEKHIPNYRVPPRVLGSRALTKIMTSPLITAFARYDYGRLRSYGETIKSIVGRDVPLSERAHALDQLAMLGVIMVGYDQLADPVAQYVTGNPNAKAMRFGSATIPQMIHDAWTGEADLSNPVRKLFHLSPVMQLLPQVEANKQLYSGKDFAKDVPDLAKNLGAALNPIKQMQQMEEGKMTGEQFFWANLGIQSPTDEEVEKKEKRKEKRLSDRAKEKSE